LQHIDQLTRDRLLKAQIKQVFPFAQFVEAHRCMEQCPTRGRVVLSVE
jgi:NADPH:quinone reductase-like Zn-dependent oxidoreductase